MFVIIQIVRFIPRQLAKFMDLLEKLYNPNTFSIYEFYLRENPDNKKLDNHPAAIKCPKCCCVHLLIWHTEYREPLDGKYDLRCRCCDYKILFQVNTIVTYSLI